MLYLIVFGLDFYNKLLILLIVLSSISIALLVLASMLYSFSSSNEAIEKYKIDPNYVPNNYSSREELKNYKIALRIFKNKILMVSIMILTILAPSVKTLYMALGIYAGQTVIEKVQNSPLATKAYTLLEQKIDEVLDETNKVKSTEKEENKK